MSDTQKTALIIEDEPDAAEMFGEMMRVNGFHIIKLLSSVHAMEALAREKPALVILDIMMPDISGLDLLRQIRGDAELAAIPVIIVSAKSLPSDIKIGLEAGASAYLTKPVGFPDLKRAIEQVFPASD